MPVASDLLKDLLRDGPVPAAELCRRLAVSQPTLSRRIAQAGDGMPLARAYWQRPAAHPLGSAGFARIAAGQQAWLDTAQGQLARVVAGTGSR